MYRGKGGYKYNALQLNGVLEELKFWASLARLVWFISFSYKICMKSRGKLTVRDCGWTSCRVVDQIALENSHEHLVTPPLVSSRNDVWGLNVVPLAAVFWTSRNARLGERCVTSKNRLRGRLERTLKFYTVDGSLPRSGLGFWLAEANFPRGTTNQKYYPCH